MPKTFLPDPKLAALVRELNHSDVQPADDVGQPWPPEHVPEGNPLERMLTDMAQRGASDLLLLTGVPPVMRIGGRPVRSEGPELEGRAMQSLLGNFLTSRIRERLHAHGPAHFSLPLHPPPTADHPRSSPF